MALAREEYSAYCCNGLFYKAVGISGCFCFGSSTFLATGATGAGEAATDF